MILESSIRKYAIDKLKQNGFYVVPLSDKKFSGLPDLMALYPGRMVFIELKRKKGFKVKQMQMFMRNMLRKAGAEAYIVNDKQAIIDIIIQKRFIDECI